jgi:hypothetical protein
MEVFRERYRIGRRPLVAVGRRAEQCGQFPHRHRIAVEHHLDWISTSESSSGDARSISQWLRSQ